MPLLCIIYANIVCESFISRFCMLIDLDVGMPKSAHQHGTPFIAASHPFIRTGSHKSMNSKHHSIGSPHQYIALSYHSTVATASDHSTMTSSSLTGKSHLLPLLQVHRVILSAITRHTKNGFQLSTQ